MASLGTSNVRLPSPLSRKRKRLRIWPPEATTFSAVSCPCRRGPDSCQSWRLLGASPSSFYGALILAAGGGINRSSRRRRGCGGGSRRCFRASFLRILQKNKSSKAAGSNCHGCFYFHDFVILTEIECANKVKVYFDAPATVAEFSFRTRVAAPMPLEHPWQR